MVESRKIRLATGLHRHSRCPTSQHKELQSPWTFYPLLAPTRCVLSRVSGPTPLRAFQLWVSVHSVTACLLGPLEQAWRSPACHPPHSEGILQPGLTDVPQAVYLTWE